MGRGGVWPQATADAVTQSAVVETSSAVFSARADRITGGGSGGMRSWREGAHVND